MGCSIDGTPEPAVRSDDRVYDSPSELFEAFRAMPFGPSTAEELDGPEGRDALVTAAHESLIADAVLVDEQHDRARWETVRLGELVGEWEAQNFGDGWGMSYWWFRVPEAVCNNAQ